MIKPRSNIIERVFTYADKLPPILGYPVVISLLFGLACLYSFVYLVFYQIIMAIRALVIGLF